MPSLISTSEQSNTHNVLQEKWTQTDVPSQNSAIQQHYNKTCGKDGKIYTMYEFEDM
jgi:hypothetical protein